jgi:hypothetical protein
MRRCETQPPGLVDQAAEAEILAGASLLKENAGRHLAEAGRLRPLHQTAESVDLAVDVAVDLKDLQEGLALLENLLNIEATHRQKT